MKPTFRVRSLWTFLCILMASFIPGNHLYSQCGTNTQQGGQSGCGRSSFYAGTFSTDAGCGVNKTISNYSPGTYFLMPVLQGGCYTVSTCGAGYDTQINAYQGASTTVGPFAYDDDAGPECSGLEASLVMTPGFTDYAGIDVRAYPCGSGGPSSINVYIRQNNNLVITSASTDMCEGDVRSLSATPVTVGVGPAGSGDPGTFYGTGVSGTTFTAPTPSGNSQTFVITYAFGFCSSTQNIIVYHAPSTANAGSNFNTACDATTATLNATAPAFGTGAWTLISGTGSITDPANPASGVTGLTPGASSTFRWTVTNGPCASNFSDITITVPTSPVVTATNGGPYCAGSTIQLNSPNGFSTDDWAGPNGYTATDDQNPSIPSSTVLMSGNYTVTVTDVNGCTGTASTNVVVNPTPIAIANNTGPYCEGATIQLSSPNGSATDDWAGPNAYSATDDQNPTIPSSTAAMSGNYTVTVTDLNACTATATTNVVVNALPVVSASNTGPYCIGATIQLNSSGFATNDWVGPNSFVAINNQNPTIASASLAMSGNYTVTVTDGNGCSATGTTNVAVNTQPVVTATNTGPYCAGATIQLNSPNGSATDDWTGPNSFVATDIQNPAIPSSTGAMSGVYTVTVTNISGCSGTATTTVVVNNLPSVTAGNTGPYCAGTTIQLTSSNASVTNDWAGPNSYTVTNTQNPTIPSAVLAMAGTYTVTATDGNNCSATSTTTVVVNALPAVSFNNTVDSVCTTSSAISLNGTSPAGGTFSGTNVTGSQFNPNSLAVGYYTITYTYTDGNSCSNSATDSIRVIGCLGVSEINGNDLVVFPNPTDGKFYLSIQNNISGDINLYLMDMSGRIVYQSIVNKGEDSLVKEIDITEERVGMYFLTVVFKNGERITKQIIKH